MFVWDFELGATGPCIETEPVIWQPEPGPPPLRLALDSVFAGA